MQTSTKKLNIVHISTSELKPAVYNPRTIDPASMEQLKESINRFGLVDPIILNSAPKRKNIVIGGHQRIKAAEELGITEIPAVYISIPNEAKEKELNLRLNRNTGQWDFEKLKSFDLEFLLDVGFDDVDLSNIWDDTLATEEDDFDVEKELEQIKKPKTKPGNIFQLGSHRLICGNSGDAEVIKKLVGNSYVDMVYTDPPFNISLDYNKGIGGKGKYGGVHTNDSRSDADYREFLKVTMQNALKVSKLSCHMFYFCDEKYIGMVQGLYEEIGLQNKRVCLWLKNNQNPTPQIAFNKVYEPCVYATRGTPYLNNKVLNLNEVMNKEVGSGNRLIDDVMDLFNIWLVKRLPGKDYQHPTEKSPTLHEKAIRRCTKPGDLILDIFGGSGSTLIAAEQLKRRCYVVEMEPIFCDLIIKRYETLTNHKAKKLN